MAALFRIILPLIGIGAVVMLLRTYNAPTPPPPAPPAASKPLVPAPAARPSGKVTWQPVGTPFIIGFDAHGNFTVEVERAIPTPWGRFEVQIGGEVSVGPAGSSGPGTSGPMPVAGGPPSNQQRVNEIERESPRPSGGFILTLRDFRRPADEVDSVYTLQSGDDSPISIWLDSRSVVQVSDHRVFIDVTNVRCLAISRTDSPDQKKWTRCVTYNSTEGWHENHAMTEMWSGPPSQPGVISFGRTSQTQCSFLRVRPEQDGRIEMLNPFTDNVFWIDAKDVGPVPGPPERIEQPNPPDQNCARAIYDR